MKGSYRNRKHRMTNLYSAMGVVRNDLGRSGKNFNIRNNMFRKLALKYRNNVKTFEVFSCNSEKIIFEIKKKNSSHNWRKGIWLGVESIMNVGRQIWSCGSGLSKK